MKLFSNKPSASLPESWCNLFTLQVLDEGANLFWRRTFELISSGSVVALMAVILGAIPPGSASMQEATRSIAGGGGSPLDGRQLPLSDGQGLS